MIFNKLFKNIELNKIKLNYILITCYNKKLYRLVLILWKHFLFFYGIFLINKAKICFFINLKITIICKILKLIDKINCFIKIKQLLVINKLNPNNFILISSIFGFKLSTINLKMGGQLLY